MDGDGNVMFQIFAWSLFPTLYVLGQYLEACLENS